MPERRRFVRIKTEQRLTISHCPHVIPSVGWAGGRPKHIKCQFAIAHALISKASDTRCSVANGRSGARALVQTSSSLNGYNADDYYAISVLAVYFDITCTCATVPYTRIVIVRIHCVCVWVCLQTFGMASAHRRHHRNGSKFNME